MISRSDLLSLHMGWRHVGFLNWPMDPAVVQQAVPDPLAVDTVDGRAWLSIVPFTNVDVRPHWLPPLFGQPLPELNLRTYVTRGDVPGVYFFNLDAEGVIGVLGGRLVHHLPYYYARISLQERDGTIAFTSRRRHPGASHARFEATYGATEEPAPSPPGSLEAFLTERYRYYAVTDGTVRCADVEHEPWEVATADVAIKTNTLFEANGFEHPESEPYHLYSPGVDTLAGPNRRLEIED